MKCRIYKLTDTDTDKLKQLLLVYEDVFGWKGFLFPPEFHLQNMLSNPKHLVFVAIINEAVIGGLTAYVLPEFESENSLVYIYDLAVKTEYQRQGIGRKLIQSVRDDCRQQANITEVFVQADEEDDYAVGFYRKTGRSEMKVRQFSYFLKP